MTDANGQPLTVGSEVTTGDDPTPLTVVFIGSHMLQVAMVVDGVPMTPWMHWSDVERVASRADPVAAMPDDWTGGTETTSTEERT